MNVAVFVNVIVFGIVAVVFVAKLSKTVLEIRTDPSRQPCTDGVRQRRRPRMPDVSLEDS